MDQFNPIDLEGLQLWLDARYGHTVFIDAEATTSASAEGDNIAVWKDLSGNGHDALSTEGTPVWQPFGFNELPTLFFDYNTQMTVQNSSEEFDGWTKLSVYAVLEEKSINTWRFWFGKSGGLNNGTNSSWHFMSRRPDQNPPKYRFRVNGTTGGDSPEISYSYSNLVHDPMLLVLTYDGVAGKRQALINGTTVIDQSNDTGSIHSTTNPLTIGGKAGSWGSIQTNFSEFIVLENVLTQTQHLELEGYLAHKWDLQGNLPSSHEYKSSPPVSAPKDFDFFDGIVDDLRIYERALSNEEVASIFDGDLSQTVHSGGQAPLVYLYWGDEDGGLNPETNASSASIWDHKVELGVREMGIFNHSLTGLELGKTYYYRFLAVNDAGSNWSAELGTFNASTFTFSEDSWTDVDMLLWLDAADINGDDNLENEPFGGTVDEWRDKSGGSRHAGNGNGPKLLYSELNGKSALSFDGEGQYLRIPDYNTALDADLDIDNEGTLFLVIRTPSIQSGDTLLSKGWTDNTGWIFRSNGSPTIGMRGLSGVDEYSSTYAWPDQFSIFGIRKTLDKLLLRIHGNQAFDLHDPGAVLDSGNKDLILGARDEAGIGNYGKFDLAELILFDQAISNTRVTEMEGYLAHKWGIAEQLPGTHSYNTSPPFFENRPEILLSNPYFLSLGEEHNFSILTNRPAISFDASGLPAGLEMNQESGVIHGTASTKGSFAALLEATNTAGSYQKEIEFIVTDFDAWKYQLELNVTGYTEAGTVKQFPLLVELNTSMDGFHYDQFSDADGKDLRFLTSDKSRELAYEVIEWNPEGSSYFWVLLPELKQGSSLLAIWGNPASKERPSYSSDGSLWQDYRAVWKMDELFGKVFRDSATGYHGEIYSPANSLVNGVIGDALSTISSSNYIELPKSAYFPEGTEQVSLSFWAFVSGGELKDQTLLHASSAVGTHMKIQLPAEDGALHWMTGSGGSVHDTAHPLSSFNDQWIYWTIQLDLLSGKSSIYQDGNLVLTQTGISLPFGASVEAFRIGSETNGAFPWEGMIDEVRISTNLEEPERIKASYHNQKPDGSDYLSMGKVKGPPIILSVTKLQSFVGKIFSSTISSFPANEGNFSAVGLPAGLSINTGTGEISGSPVQDGQYQVTIILENEFGKVTKNLPMSVFDPSAFSKQMEFDCAHYPGSTTLIDFPLLIEMNGSITGFNLRQFASSTGNDLRFFDDSGKEYEYEIETFDLAANRLVVWVKVPSLTSSTVFSAYWGNTSLAESPPSYSINGGVWSSGYRGVWHMRPTSESIILSDSSSYRNHLTDLNGITQLSGVAGTGRQLFGEPDHYLSAPTNPSLENLALDSYSFSGWVFLDGTPEDRINETFYILGYDRAPEESFFDSAPDTFLSLEPDGGRIVRNGPNNQGLDFSSADDFKAMDVGITRTSGFMSALMTRFTPQVSASYQFKIVVDENDFASLWFDQNRSGSFSSGSDICRSDLPISQPLALEEGKAYNLLLAHGVPTGEISTSLRLEVKSDDESLPDWTLIDPANPDQNKLYHLTFDGNLSDRISSVTLFQDGPTERLNLLGLQPQATHRKVSGNSVQADGNSSLSPQQWMHLFTQVDGDTNQLEIYLNGNRIAAETLGENAFPPNSSAAPWRFGLSTLPLALDEIRLADQTRSPDWILASYQNQSQSSGFPLIGDIEGENSFLLPALSFETPAESYFELFVNATGSPLAFLATGLPGGMSINPADGNLSGTPVQAGTYPIELEAYYLDQSIAKQAITLEVTAGLPVISLDEVISDTTPTLTLHYNISATGGDEPNVIAVADSEDRGTNLYDWQYRLDLGKQGFGPGTFQMKGLDADKRYYVRLLAQNLAGSQWTGKETIINRIPVPDDLPSSLFPLV